jgi:hypothetical protein
MEKLCEMFVSHIMKMAVFWDVMPCSSVDRDQRFGRTYCFHLLSRRMIYPEDGGSRFL